MPAGRTPSGLRRGSKRRTAPASRQMSARRSVSADPDPGLTLAPPHGPPSRPQTGGGPSVSRSAPDAGQIPTQGVGGTIPSSSEPNLPESLPLTAHSTPEVARRAAFHH